MYCRQCTCHPFDLSRTLWLTLRLQKLGALEAMWIGMSTADQKDYMDEHTFSQEQESVTELLAGPRDHWMVVSYCCGVAKRCVVHHVMPCVQ